MAVSPAPYAGFDAVIGFQSDSPGRSVVFRDWSGFPELGSDARSPFYEMRYRWTMFSRTPRWSFFSATLLVMSCDAGGQAPAPGSSVPSTSSHDSALPTSEARPPSEPSSKDAPNNDSEVTSAPPPSSVAPGSDPQETHDGATAVTDSATPPPQTSTPPADSATAIDATTTNLPDGVPHEGVAIVGRAIYVDGKLFHIKGVNWNPVAKGNVHPDNLDFAGFADQDIALMKAAGINAVRTYERLESREVLDKLHAAGIYVFSTVLGWWQDDASVVTDRVNAVKDHPAILAWVLGNEWNYNQLYSDGQLSNAQVRDKLNDAASFVKAADPNHPVATIYGELGDIEGMIESMPNIDLWGINAYRGIDHAALFTQWAALSTKPMFLGEYGADAWDSRNGGMEDLAAQAEATTALTQQLVDAYTTTDGGIASGGFIFEWADEWWKAGNPDVHDNGGQAPGGGPYPDATFNEEWWGLVDIDRNPRPAYEALKALYL